MKLQEDHLLEARRFSVEQSVKFHTAAATMRPAPATDVIATATAIEAFLLRPAESTEG